MKDTRHIRKPRPETKAWKSLVALRHPGAATYGDVNMKNAEGTYGLQAFHRLREVAHEGERADALTQPRDPPEAEHESIFVRQRLYFTALLLVIDQRLHLVV